MRPEATTANSLPRWRRSPSAARRVASLSGWTLDDGQEPLRLRCERTLPDFRAAERSFQLLMQVAGRAGRSPLGGRVVVQTYNPDQVAIEAAANHDYEGFYHTELAFRREQNYPPFKRLALLLYSGPGPDRSAAAGRRPGRHRRSFRYFVTIGQLTISLF